MWNLLTKYCFKFRHIPRVQKRKLIQTSFEFEYVLMIISIKT